MRILGQPGESVWEGPGPRHGGLFHGFLHNLCATMCSCVYVFCCCWLLEDCLAGHRSFPGPGFGGPPPPPPPPPYVGPEPPHGILGSIMGPPGPPHLHGPFGYPGEAPPPPPPPY